MSYGNYTDYFIDDVNDEVVLINENEEDLNDKLHQCQYGHMFNDRFILKLTSKKEIIDFLKYDFGIKELVNFYQVIYQKKITKEEAEKMIENDTNNTYENVIMNFKQYYSDYYELHGIDVPDILCPICNFKTIPDDIVKEYMFDKTKEDFHIYRNIEKKYKYENNNYPIRNSDFFEYMNDKYGLKVSEIKKEIKEKYKNYGDFIKNKARD